MNRLADETSPYLLQHADNPVHWYPWGEEALSNAVSADKPILLSVGYSSCHWCHVMAHESFAHEETAALMNEHFVNIKVDREERPDIDALYMSAVQILTKGGGWPMTVFLLPDGRPFHGGTYFPLEPRFGMPSFRQLLLGIAKIYRERRDEVERIADQLTHWISADHLKPAADGSEAISAAVLQQAQQQVSAEYDPVHGGFGQAPKFPQPMTLDFLLRRSLSKQESSLLEQVSHTLDCMARGGIYDQLGGGFARYSVDEKWLVPHFEKMLYDNAQLSRLYLHAWQRTGDGYFLQIAHEIFDYVLREMTAPDGGFYSATDADSEGVEGKFFVWERAEIAALLNDDAALFCSFWGVTETGNFEGKNILHLPMREEEFIQFHTLREAEWKIKLAQARSLLFQERATRVPPFLDDKIITSWNGLMLASLAEAARILGRMDYQWAARKAGEFMRNDLKAENGGLLRTHRQGISKIPAYLEDYACFIDGLLELYQLTHDEVWFVEARGWAEYVIQHFSSEMGGFFDSGDMHEALLTRSRNFQDGAFPSANAHFAKQLLRLSTYTGNAEWERAATAVLNHTLSAVTQYPAAFAGSLNVMEQLLHGIAEVAIIGDPSHEETQRLIAVLDETYRPNLIRAVASEEAAAISEIPLLQGRTMLDGKATAYVCQNFHCRLPVTQPAALRAQLTELQ